MTVVSGLPENKGTLALVIKGNCYEVRQTLKLYVFVGIFDLDRAQIDFEMCWSNRTNRSVPVKTFIYVITKDCARSRFFQQKLQQHYYQF